MTTQPSVDAVQEIVAEMQYLLGVAEDSAYSETSETSETAPIEVASE